jgi:hypothetical protein
MKRFIFTLAAIGTALLAACSGDDHGTTGAAATSTPAAQATNAAAGPLLFGIGMHIEPVGATAQETQQRSAGAPAGKERPGDYNKPDGYNRAVDQISAVAAIVEEHGGHLTVQTQSPFTTATVATGSTFLSDLEDRGHEIGLHFHEGNHMGNNSESASPEKWCAVLKQEVGFIKQAGVDHVAYWSGGNVYPAMYDAAVCAGLSVNSDWKNPATQTTDATLQGTVSWRPAGGTDGVDVTKFAQHSPDGKVVFLPEGDFGRDDFASMRRSEDAGGDEAYFAYLKERLLASIEGAQAGKVNVFHFTVHPNEFAGSNGKYEVIERFLAEVVDPLVKQGKVQWATFSQMADAFSNWEKQNPGVDPRAGQTVAAASTGASARPAAPTIPAQAQSGRPQPPARPRSSRPEGK